MTEENLPEMIRIYNEGRIPCHAIARMYHITEKHLFALVKLFRDEEEGTSNDES